MNHRHASPFLLLVLLFCLALLFGRGARADLALTDQPGPDDFILATNSVAARILLDPAEHRSVLRAAEDLRADIRRVSGATTNGSPENRRTVVIGTLGRSAAIDALAREGKISADDIRGQWESYVLQVVPRPDPDTDIALVIAGSDRRGTIYGIYELSELIGISPWCWWADVPVKHHRLLAIRAGRTRHGPPAVRYRGIFLNDEDWGLRPWAAQTFEPETGNIGPKTYAAVFELLLRLRANYLWPAMHEGTPAFNAYATNKELADLYGIVMGSSHCEQMLRDNVDEWKRDGTGEYNYASNREGVLRYWEQRVRENGRFENVYTVGMRGIHDSGMPGGGSPKEQAERLHRIIDDQRELLRRWVNTNVAAVPQIFCPYKEVLDLYRLAPGLPDDITLVWPDDNHGYVRQFSNAGEQQRSGAAGVYYHLSYWGRPRDYLWLCSTAPALVAEEMTKAYAYGANRLWVVNVGDLKPAELGMEFFLRLAWNPRAWTPGNAGELLEQQLARDFGPQHAGVIGGILAEYYRLNFQRKPEHLGFTIHGTNAGTLFSTMRNGDEAGARLEAWRALVERTETAAAQLPPQSRNAYFQLVDYPVRAAALMNEKWLTLTKYHEGARQGRISAYEYPRQAQRAHDQIQLLTDQYNSLAAGKWRHMMSANPRLQPVFDLPTIPVPNIPFEPARLGIVPEGTDRAVFARVEEPLLPQFNSLTRRTYFVDVFNAGTGFLQWQAMPAADWIRLDRTGGDQDARVRVGIDWSRVPAGDDVRSTIRFAVTNQQVTVAVSVFNPADTNGIGDADFVEDNRRIVMEAEHASAWLPGQDATWEVIRGLGYNGEAVSVFPVTAAVRRQPELIRRESPALQYRVWLRTAGDWRVIVRALPTFSVEAGAAQRYAVAWDDRPPRIITLPAATSERDRVWGENVLRNAALTTSVDKLDRAGLHTLKLWMVDPGIVIDTIVCETGEKQDLGYTWPVETRVGARFDAQP